jgi:hypothetical protein
MCNMEGRSMGQSGETRREFARDAAAAAAALLGGACARSGTPARAPAPPSPPELPRPSRLEADARVELILSRWGDRLSEEQRTKLRRFAYDAQRELDAIRAYPLEAGDEPTPVFRVYRAR